MPDEQPLVAPPLMGLLLTPPESHNDLPEPVNGPYFIALRDGYKMVKQTHWGKAVIPAPEIPSLPQYKARAILWYPEQRIPTEFIAQIWGFFLQVFKDIQSEAMIYITHKDGQYRAFIPPQKVNKVAVKANFSPENVGDWQVVGTIHSHCDFGAHHSATDNHDADGMDGLHITIGNVNQYKPTVAIMISVNKMKWDLTPEEIFSEGMPADPAPHPVWWHRYIEKDTPHVVTTMYGSYNNGGGKQPNNPPSQARTGQGSKKKDRQRQAQANNASHNGRKRNPKNDKIAAIDIDDLDMDIASVFETLDSYTVWNIFTSAEIEAVENHLTKRWEDLTSDLASIGIWADMAATPIWNVTKSFNVKEMRGEMMELIQRVMPGRTEVKSTDARDWTNQEDYTALLGES